MGFDLYGMNPKTDSPEPPQPAMTGANWTEKEYAQWDVYSKWREASGGYFRNNVWAWRPLWYFVSKVCDDILTREDINLGNENSGHKISWKKSEAIAERLYQLIEDGSVEAFESEFEDDRGYDFFEENVRDFAYFCSKCGGFEIC